MKYNKETKTIKLSVRELVEITLGGSPGRPRAGFPPDSVSASAGRAAHSELQSRESGFRTEVMLSHTCSEGGITFEVTGRADRIYFGGEIITVDEIKATGGEGIMAGESGDKSGDKSGDESGDESPVEPDAPVFDGIPPHEPDDRISTNMHLAQVKCYAYFLCEEYSREEINVRLTYYNVRTKKSTHRDRLCTRGGLRQFYYDLLSRAGRWAKLEVNRDERVLPSVRASGFPHKVMRRGQNEFILAAYRAIKRGERLFAEAPTGIGKTISALYPAAVAIGAGKCDRVFYMTAKASARSAAFDAARQLFLGGIILRTVVLYAREQLCPLGGGRSARSEGIGCNRFDCELLRDYDSRAADAVWDLLCRRSGYPRQSILECAARHKICPFELSLDLSLHCDVIICDYNYLFDPQARLARYFRTDRGEKYAFLIDEAHNLPDRARQMFSSQLFRRDFERLMLLLGEMAAASVAAAAESAVMDAAEIGGAINEMISLLDGIIVEFNQLERHCEDDAVYGADGTQLGFYRTCEPFGGLNRAAAVFYAVCDRRLRMFRGLDCHKPLLDCFYKLREYLCLLDYYDDKFISYAELIGGEVSARIFCLDPSGVINDSLGEENAAVLFSATLTPGEYFTDVLGGGKRARRLTLPSPYDPGRLCIAAVDTVSTVYSAREANAPVIAELIYAAVNTRDGNYIAYFPSYDFMNSVYEVFAATYPEIDIAVQKRGMTSEQREGFLAGFRESGTPLTGFCVLGGSFSEGIDLPGKRLIGSIIIGVGLPRISTELNLIRDYYDAKIERGFEYVYVFPGMNKILQAAGRVIRNENDRGVVVLIDERYSRGDYVRLFPEHWQGIKFIGNAKSLNTYISNFWNGF